MAWQWPCRPESGNRSLIRFAATMTLPSEGDLSRLRDRKNMKTEAASHARLESVMSLPLEERQRMMRRLAAIRCGLQSYRANMARGVDPAARAREGKRRRHEQRLAWTEPPARRKVLPTA